MLGQPPQRLHAVIVLAPCQLRQCLERSIQPAALLLHLRNVPQRSKRQVVAQSALHCALNQRQPAFAFPGREQPPPNAQHLFSAPQSQPFQTLGVGAAKRRGNNRRQATQRQNIDRVVMENRNQPSRLLATQVLEVNIRNHFPRQITLSLEAQNLILEETQPAILKSQFPYPARSMQ